MAQRGAQPDNINAIRHGLRMTLGRLPNGCAWISECVSAFRREVERALTADGEAITPRQAALIQSACRYEQAAMLATKWLRKESDKMTAVERLQYLATVTRCTGMRDTALRSLGLDGAKSTAGDSEAYHDVVARILAARERQGASNGQEASQEPTAAV